MSVDARLRLELTPAQVGYVRAALRSSQLSIRGPEASFVSIEVAALLADINEQIVEQTCRENNIPPPSRDPRGPLSTEGFDSAYLYEFFGPDPYQDA